MFEFEARRISLQIVASLLQKLPKEKREEEACKLAREAGVERDQASDYARDMALMYCNP